MRSFMTAIVAAAVLVAVAGCPRSMRPAPKDRRTLLVLVDDGRGGCFAKVVDRHSARRNDSVTWQVWNFCSVAQRAEIVFTKAGNPLTGGSLTSEPSGSSSRWRDIGGRVTGEPREYPYEVRVNGTTAVDPVLEVDP